MVSVPVCLLVIVVPSKEAFSALERHLPDIGLSMSLCLQASRIYVGGLDTRITERDLEDEVPHPLDPACLLTGGFRF